MTVRHQVPLFRVLWCSSHPCSLADQQEEHRTKNTETWLKLLFDPLTVGRDPGEFSDIFKTNVVGPYLVTRALLPLIKKGKKKQVRSL